MRGQCVVGPAAWPATDCTGPVDVAAEPPRWSGYNFPTWLTTIALSLQGYVNHHVRLGPRPPGHPQDCHRVGGGEEEPLAGAWAGVEGSGEHRLVDWSKTMIYSSLQVVETATLTRTVAMYTTSDNT